MDAMKIREKLGSAEGIASLLTLEDFGSVYALADRTRREAVGDTVHLRAIIEFSNICRRRCIYCGLNRENMNIPRYRMTDEEILETARDAVQAGYRTVVLQSGEDEYYTAERLGDIIKEIKKMTVGGGDADDADGKRTGETDGAGMAEPVHPAVTVSCGERPREDYVVWRKAGADRYLLKHETADPALYDRFHPCGTLADRVGCLKTLKELGYETGSGFMVGLPGQTPLTLAEDLLLLKEIPCKMAGIGPFISNPKTPLAGEPDGDPETARRAVAIARLLLPDANLPLTTSLAILAGQQGDGEMENPFAFGANVVMKKVTPDRYKEAYEIYPAALGKTDIIKDRRELELMISRCGRQPL